jgi:polyphenol oxidase
MTSSMNSWTVRPTGIGRVIVPAPMDARTIVFWTSGDFSGYLDDGALGRLLDVIGELRRGRANLSTCEQVHGTTATRVDLPSAEWSECSRCDALGSTSRDVALAIKVADCLPVSIVDADQGFVVNLHAGWRGAAAGIASGTLDELAASGFRPSPSTRVYLGPSIQLCCFEVGEEVVDAFRARNPDADRFVDRTLGPKPHLDLAGLVTEELRRNGVNLENIWNGGLCTRCEGSIFHSYRRSGPSAGRNLAVAALR